jgi:hypothetical protein
VGIVNGVVVEADTGSPHKTLFTDVFAYRDGRWQAINAQELPLGPRRIDGYCDVAARQDLEKIEQVCNVPVFGSKQLPDTCLEPEPVYGKSPMAASANISAIPDFLDVELWRIESGTVDERSRLLSPGICFSVPTAVRASQLTMRPLSGAPPVSGVQ